MSKPERILVIYLRVSAVIMLAAVLAVVMPRQMMADVHAWLGLGQLPQAPIVDYLARSTSALYAMLGGLLWLVASDVKRYAAVIFYIGVAGIPFAVAMSIVDVVNGMPRWWTMHEGVVTLLMSIAILVLIRLVKKEAATASLPRE